MATPLYRWENFANHISLLSNKIDPIRCSEKSKSLILNYTNSNKDQKWYISGGGVITDSDAPYGDNEYLLFNTSWATEETTSSVSAIANRLDNNSGRALVYNDSVLSQYTSYKFTVWANGNSNLYYINTSGYNALYTVQYTTGINTFWKPSDKFNGNSRIEFSLGLGFKIYFFTPYIGCTNLSLLRQSIRLHEAIIVPHIFLVIAWDNVAQTLFSSEVINTDTTLIGGNAMYIKTGYTLTIPLDSYNYEMKYAIVACNAGSTMFYISKCLVAQICITENNYIADYADFEKKIKEYEIDKISLFNDVLYDLVPPK